MRRECTNWCSMSSHLSICALFGHETRIRTVRHVLVAFLWIKLSKRLKICIRRTTAVKKAGIRSAHRKSRTKIFVRSRTKVHLFSFKGVVSSDSGLFNSLKIRPVRWTELFSFQISDRNRGSILFPPHSVYRKVASVSLAKNMYPLKRKGKLSLDLFPCFISLFATEYTDANAEKKLKSFSWVTGSKYATLI